VAVLTRFLGDISFAEEAVQEALAITLAKWPSTGVPPSPVGWLITTARNEALVAAGVSHDLPLAFSVAPHGSCRGSP
jgi:predicted RNA polymerase sigma factor